ncbi:MAG: ribose-phosphate diphosphokinase [Candidatus Sumerlaeota bacterium]
MHFEQPQVFAGSASEGLAHDICEYMGVPVAKSQTKHFSDGETWVKIDQNVRGARCFVVQSTCPPTNEHLMELLQLLDALRRASAASVTAVIPYFGYARQDRKDQGRVALSAKLVANLLHVAGAARVLTIDLHSGQIQGFFDIPVDHLYASTVIVDHIRELDIPDLVVVSPDVGNVKRARSYAQALNAPLTIIDKRRPEPNVSEVMNIIGDVKGRNAFLFDDLIDTAGTICYGAEALIEAGAKDVYAACTHPVLSGPARDRLAKSPLKRVYVTDTIPQKNDDSLDKLEIVSVAQLLGEAIWRIHHNQSVSELFNLFDSSVRKHQAQAELELFPEGKKKDDE